MSHLNKITGREPVHYVFKSYEVVKNAYLLFHSGVGFLLERNYVGKFIRYKTVPNENNEIILEQFDSIQVRIEPPSGTR